MIEGRAARSGVEPQAQETEHGTADTIIGMDLHKNTIVVAVTAAGDSGKATPHGIFPNSAAALEKLVKCLRQAAAGHWFRYEAGPCGYAVHCILTPSGEACMVVGPSMIFRRSGERRKNDTRDADGPAVAPRRVADRGPGCRMRRTKRCAI